MAMDMNVDMDKILYSFDAIGLFVSFFQLDTYFTYEAL
jgi:hypothetical protein